MNDLECPRCKTTKYQNPSIVVMINTCGHSLCKECVELLFIKGSGNCVECGVPLRRTDFRVKLFDDNTVEKEIEIRKRIMRDYYRCEDDFDTLDAYNDYLENMEDMIYNLAHNINVDEINEKIEQYRKENKEQIFKSKARYYRVLAQLDGLVDEEKQKEECKKQEFEEEELASKRRKVLEKEALIDELSYSEKDAKNILDFFSEAKADYQQKGKEDKGIQKEIKKANKFSSGASIGCSSIYGRIPKFELAPLYVYQPPEIIWEGPSVPTEEEIASKPYLNYLRKETVLETAVGFSMKKVCLRLLQEAMSGLYYAAPSTIDTEGET